MRRALRAFHVGLLTLLLAGSGLRAQQHEIVLATTTSTQDTGLLDSLLPMFQQETGIAVKPIAVGTGAALEMARRGDADAVLVHAPEVERKYVQSGDIIDGRRIMYNDFLIIGPAGDPAGAKGKPLIEAMKAIAGGGSFVSRGDGSGTETKELALWKAQRQTYTLTDRATYLAFKEKLTLVPLVQGDPELRNVYSAYTVNPGKNPAAKRAEALRFVRYLTEPKVQEWIGRYGTEKWGEPLFHPDAQVSASR